MWKKTCMFMVSMKPSTIIVKFMVVESGVRTKGGLISPFNEKVLVLNKKTYIPSFHCARGGRKTEFMIMIVHEIKTSNKIVIHGPLVRRLAPWAWLIWPYCQHVINLKNILLFFHCRGDI